jgi:hypothetical protein
VKPAELDTVRSLVAETDPSPRPRPGQPGEGRGAGNWFG